MYFNFKHVSQTNLTIGLMFGLCFAVFLELAANNQEDITQLIISIAKITVAAYFEATSLITNAIGLCMIIIADIVNHLFLLMGLIAKQETVNHVYQFLKLLVYLNLNIFASTLLYYNFKPVYTWSKQKLNDFLSDDNKEQQNNEEFEDNDKQNNNEEDNDEQHQTNTIQCNNSNSSNSSDSSNSSNSQKIDNSITINPIPIEHQYDIDSENTIISTPENSDTDGGTDDDNLNYDNVVPSCNNGDSFNNNRDDTNISSLNEDKEKEEHFQKTYLEPIFVSNVDQVENKLHGSFGDEEIDSNNETAIEKKTATNEKNKQDNTQKTESSYETKQSVLSDSACIMPYKGTMYYVDDINEKVYEAISIDSENYEVGKEMGTCRNGNISLHNSHKKANFNESVFG